MPDLSDESASLIIDNVPRKGATQLRRTQRVNRATRIFLTADI
jgi:hypothetical protein